MKHLNRTLSIFLVLVVGLCGIAAAGTTEPAGSHKIVVFYEDVSWEEVTQYAEEWEPYGVKTLMELPFINALVMVVPQNITSSDLSDDPRVAGVENDQVLNLKTQGDSFIKPVDKPAGKIYPWGALKLYGHPYDNQLDDIDRDMVDKNILYAMKKMRRNRVRIAIFDTGIFHNRPEIKDKFMGGIDLVHPAVDIKGKRKGKIFEKNKFTSINDDNGHGTHVAGIIATALDKQFKWGKKAEFELYAVKILDHEAKGELSNIIMGLQWAIEQGIDIVNMSIGYRQSSLAVQLAVQQAHKTGLIMVASVGNKSNYDDDVTLVGHGDGGAGDGGAGDGGAGDGGAGDGGAGDGGAGDGGAGDGGAGDGGAGDGGAGDGGSNPLEYPSVMYPARYPEVISVGATTLEGELAPFSNYDATMDLLAPGANIVSYDITNGNKRENYGSCSGTSMAAPYVTAAIAMMLVVDPSLGPDGILNLLGNTADYSLGQPFGEIDLVAALDLIINGVPIEQNQESDEIEDDDDGNEE